MFHIILSWILVMMTDSLNCSDFNSSDDDPSDTEDVGCQSAAGNIQIKYDQGNMIIIFRNGQGQNNDPVSALGC